MNNLPRHIVYTADLGALFSIIGANLGAVSTSVAIIAGMFGIAYYAIQIWDRFNR